MLYNKHNCSLFTENKQVVKQTCFQYKVFDKKVTKVTASEILLKKG